MSDINKVILIGHTGSEFELRYLPSGSMVGSVNLATSKTWREKTSGSVQERTTWHKIVIHGQNAEYLKKNAGIGSQLYIEGELQTRKFEREGKTEYITEIVVSGWDGKSKLLNAKGLSKNPPSAGNSSYNEPPLDNSYENGYGE